MLKINVFFLFLISFLILYKSILIHYGLDKIVYVLIAAFIGILSMVFIVRLKIKKSILWLLPFIILGLVSLLISMLNGSFFMGTVGFLGMYLFFFFWILSFSSVGEPDRYTLFNIYIRIQIVLAIVMTVFAIYQFFYNPTLFGIKPHELYSNVDILDVIVTRRATSFIGSTQNLGIYLGVMCGFLMLTDFRWIAKMLLLSLFFIGGILSGTRAFFLFIVIFFFAYYFRHLENFGSLLSMLIIGLFFYSLIIIFQRMNVEVAHRVYVLADKGVVSHFDFWLPFITHDNLYHYIFGQGIGTAERLSEVLTDNYVPNTESYLLKLYHEIGISGLCAFLLAYGVSMYNAFKKKSRFGKAIFAILLGLITNLVATPSFAGLTMSFVIWPIILFPLSSSLGFKLQLTTFKERKYGFRLWH